jgi:iron complex transport system ATP-binding protein
LTSSTLRLAGVEVVAAGAPRPLLQVGSWTVRGGEHWAVVGGNGAGKSTLLGVSAGRLAPARGRVEILGMPPGAPGLADPRLRVGILEGTPRTFAGELTAVEVVTLPQAGPAAVLGAPRDPAERDRAHVLLELLDAGHLAQRRYGSCSAGERQRVLLARTLMRDPGLLLLDEPVASLDLPGREALLRALERLAAVRGDLASITVTHHLEELPVTTTHALLLRDGAVIAAGPADDVIDDVHLRACFGIEVSVTRAGGRWLAQLARAAA